jgi:hypothetical protein
VGPLNSQMTYIYMVKSVFKFGGILVTAIWLTALSCYAAGPLKVRLSFRSQSVPPPIPKPLHKHRYIHSHLVTAHFSQLTTVCFDCHSLWVEISTLAYEVKSLPWREGLSVAYCTHVIQTKVMLKNQRYPQISMFTATGWAHRPASFSSGVICRGCGLVTCNIQPSIY